MALSANAPRVYETQSWMNMQPVKASAVIYQGAVVGNSGGYARAYVDADGFMGFALEAVTGGATDGLVYVNVAKNGVVKLPITSVAVTDWGKLVYASDDGTFTLTASTHTIIGRISRWVATGFVMVAFNVDNTTL